MRDRLSSEAIAALKMGGVNGGALKPKHGQPDQNIFEGANKVTRLWERDYSGERRIAAARLGQMKPATIGTIGVATGALIAAVLFLPVARISARYHFQEGFSHGVRWQVNAQNLMAENCKLRAKLSEHQPILPDPRDYISLR